MSRFATRAFVACAVVLAFATSARAATCTFMSATAPALGSYDVFNPMSTDSAGNVAYTCTGGATVTISISMGNGPTFSPRHLQRMGGFLMSYNLYLDPGHSMIWGDGTGPSLMSPPNAPADGAVVMVPVFASIPAHQDVGLGTYTDNVMVTLNF